MPRTVWVQQAVPLGLCCIGLASSASAQPAGEAAQDEPWYGLHFLVSSAEQVAALKRLVGEVVAPMGINVVIVEVSFRFQSHPEVGEQGGITADDARQMAEVCRQHGIRLIPMFNCLGHQSWAETNGALLSAHPEFDETPGKYPNNEGIYCRSWCPLHPEVNSVVFDMMDEVVEAFRADAFHVGMDEVFLIADADCPRCSGKDPAELFAKAVNDYHQHLVGERHVEMLMWGDRLLDAATMPYGHWEASANGTAPAAGMVPKDIIICDWHYPLLDDYPSVRYFQEKGFRVWPAGWNNEAATLALIDCARRDATEKMLGHLFTTWCDPSHVAAVLLGEEGAPDISDTARGVGAALRAGMARLSPA